MNMAVLHVSDAGQPAPCGSGYLAFYLRSASSSGVGFIASEGTGGGGASAPWRGDGAYLLLLRAR